MPKYSTGLLVNGLRERIGLEREIIAEVSNLDEASMRRIESETQNPKLNTLKKLFEIIDLPIEGFIYPLLDELPMGALLLCDRLTQLLDMDDTVAAEAVLMQLEEYPKVETGVLTQFILSSKARLWEQQGKSIEEILPLIEEGMTETFYNFNDVDIADKVFVLEEPELMYTKARLLASSGQLKEAIIILENIISGLVKIPSADKEKERQFAPMILSLTKCLLQTCDYNRVLELCEIGSDYSAARRYGYLNPDFELHKAFALKGLGRDNECKSTLQHAYFGYILRGESDKAKEVLINAKSDFKIQFSTYGVDKLDFSNQYQVPYNRGEAVNCYSFGTMIRALREKADLSMEQLCRGICSKQTLLRIENDDTLENFFINEAIMQRLGRDINLYKNFFLSRNDFIVLQLRDRIKMLVIERKYKRASELLGELENTKRVSHNRVIRQFIKMMQAILFAGKHDEPHPKFPVMLLDALRITCPQFDENKIENYQLTYNEIAIISQYAGYFGDTNEPNRSAAIYSRLRRNLNGKYTDEVEKARMYSTVVFNCSSALGRAGRIGEALEIIEEGESFERNRRRIIELPGFAFNKGYDLLLLERKEECLPFLALAYYGASLFAKHGQEYFLPTIKMTVEKHLGVVFD